MSSPQAKVRMEHLTKAPYWGFLINKTIFPIIACYIDAKDLVNMAAHNGKPMPLWWKALCEQNKYTVGELEEDICNALQGTDYEHVLEKLQYTPPKENKNIVMMENEHVPAEDNKYGIVKNENVPAEDDIPESLLCSICFDLLYNPVSVECGHTFCRICIEEHCHTCIKNKVPPDCPLCRGTLPQKQAQGQQQWTINITLRDIIEKLYPEDYAARNQSN